ncbi:MAG: glycosyltransferase family 4 protein [Gammaproteobacteria bacterium]
MRIAYTTIFDARDVHAWSGTPTYMSQAFSQEGVAVDYIGSLKQTLSPFFKVKQLWNKYIAGERESPRFNPTVLKSYSMQVAEQLNHLSVDAVVSPLINPIAYLDCKQPIVLWTDALYSALTGFYSPTSAPTSISLAQGNRATAECLSRCKLAIFSSDWAARSAIELYGANRDAVKVVPFGANIDSYPSYEEVCQLINRRSKDKIKLLFLGKEWERKGGDTVLAVARTLHEAGHAVELTIVGCMPPEPSPSYVTCLGFISKHEQEGKEHIRQLLSETHFLFVPSRAEAYGIVFCEANAFGVPCLTTYIGGIGTVVRDNVNGMTFGLYASVMDYVNYIVGLMQNRAAYNELALSAYHEYESRLNWKVSVREVKRLIEEVR